MSELIFLYDKLYYKKWVGAVDGNHCGSKIDSGDNGCDGEVDDVAGSFVWNELSSLME